MSKQAPVCFRELELSQSYKDTEGAVWQRGPGAGEGTTIASSLRQQTWEINRTGKQCPPNQGADLTGEWPTQANLQSSSLPANFLGGQGHLGVYFLKGEAVSSLVSK